MGFRWADETRGERIEAWIDSMCLRFPGVMYDVLKAGIGNLHSWYSGARAERANDEEKWKLATCGCLVGTVAIHAKKIPGACNIMEREADGYGDEPAWIFYLATCAASRKRPISHRALPMMLASLCDEDVETTKYPRILVDTYQVGMFASEEGGAILVDWWLTWTDREARRAKREREVRKYMMERIRANLVLMGYVKPHIIQRIGKRLRKTA